MFTLGNVTHMASENMLAALGEGPARLSSDDVAASQRRRMLAAMVSAVAEKGYVAVAVADVTKRARVSRATFYEQFEDKADCFVAAVRACVDQLVGRINDRAHQRLEPRPRLHAVLDAYLGGLAAFPEGARVCLVEMYAAGPRAVDARREAQLDFARFIRTVHTDMAEAGEPVRPLSDFDMELVVGAIGSLATNRVASGETARLPELLEPIEAFVLANFGLPRPTSPT
jgi:AcrR family transcriptional regulator